MNSCLRIQAKGRIIGEVKRLIGFTSQYVVIEAYDRPKEELINLSENIVLENGKTLAELTEEDGILYFTNKDNEIIGSSDQPRKEEVAKKLHEVLR